MRLIQESNHRLQAISPLIPSSMRSSVRAGPIQGSTWYLLVNSSAVAAKLRQLTPLLVQALQQTGQTVSLIQIKVQIRSTTD